MGMRRRVNSSSPCAIEPQLKPVKSLFSKFVFGRRRRWVFLALILLFISFLFRNWVVLRPAVPDGWTLVEVALPVDGGEPGETVRLACQDTRPGGPGSESVPTLVLLHGSRASSETVGHLVRYLKEDFRLIVPDFPGFGNSPPSSGDASAATQARRVAGMLDRLDVARAHVLGFSLGGVVAVELADAYPERVQSMTLVSSVGVQEFDLLGDRIINHSLYTLQWMVLGGLQELTPHFGLFDLIPFNRSYAAFLRDTDLRPIRDMLKRHEGPVLVVHGTDDPLVPFKSAEEHQRLVPQSNLVTLKGGHGLVYDQPAEVARVVRTFVTAVEENRIPLRSEAEPDRLEAAAVPFSPQRSEVMSGTRLLLAGVALALATLISEDLTCIAAGLLVSQNVLPFWPATLACLVGIVVGDILLLLLGRALRRVAWDLSVVRFFVTPEAITHGEHWIERKGPLVALISRFTPGTRLATFLAAGLLGVSLFRFSVYFIIAATLWTPILVGLSASLGSVVMEFWADYEQYALTGLLAVAVVLFGFFKIGIPLLTHRGRRLLWSRYQRVTRWEFWPPWVFYPPLVLYILWLGLRFRHLTLFTAVNPSMPQSGFLGESKSAILEGLADAGDSVARWRLLPGGLSTERRLDAMKRFMAERGLGFPVVIKPDVGQRGSGVSIVHSEPEAREALDRLTGPVIAQEFVDGPEFGIFYLRRPSEAFGRIFSVTEKQGLRLTGDGKRTIEELILDHERAVCMARYHLREHAAHMDDVPAEGELYPLVEIGAHCRGSLFLDGSRIVTPELERAIDRMAKCDPGFFFGRFDIRAASEEAFRRGEDLKILELNGVTSEATHIYDPATGLFQAYRILARQWREAFEIAAQNRSRGFKATAPFDLCRLILASWSRQTTGDFSDKAFPPLTKQTLDGNSGIAPRKSETQPD